MKTFVLIFFLGSVYGGLPGVWVDDANFTPKIIKGKDAEEGEFPFMASIRRKLDNMHGCGGTILTKDWVLTAAHCCRRVAAEDMSVHVGSIYLNKGGKYHSGEKAIIHEDYDPDQLWRNDVCLLRVKIPFAFGKNVQQVTLPTQNWPVLSGVNLTVSGWGYTNSSLGPQSPPNRLQKADTFISLSNEECYDETETDMIPGYLCARGGIKGQGICNGDSGSPILKNKVQVGISSWVYLPCGSGRPDFFARVSVYISWMKRKLGSDASQLKFVA